MNHRLSDFNPRGTDVSVIMDLMIHDIDIILNINNSKVKKIDASGVSIISSTPDIANARIRFKNGTVSNITSSRIAKNKVRKILNTENFSIIIKANDMQDEANKIFIILKISTIFIF